MQIKEDNTQPWTMRIRPHERLWHIDLGETCTPVCSTLPFIVLALKDINFSIEQGDVIGIIGMLET